MRILLLSITILAGASFVEAQEKARSADDLTPPRYGQAYRPKAYPQTNPKLALESVINAADRNEVSYLVAHLLDPAFVDGRLQERGRFYEAQVEVELLALREFQRKNPELVALGARLPDDGVKFRARVTDDARLRAFGQLVREVKEKLVDDPETLKDLRRFYRSGSFPEAGSPELVAKVGLPDIKDRAVFMKKNGDRWFIENRQSDEKSAAAAKKE